MLGRDGWYYWLGEDGQSLDRHYRGVRVMPDIEVDDTWRGRAPQRVAARARHRVRDVIVPEKFTIYPEYLPVVGRAVAAADACWRGRWIDWRRTARVAYVDLRPLLRAAKGSAEPLYYQTDSHWNLAGAGVGYVGDHAGVQDCCPDASRRLPRRCAHRTCPAGCLLGRSRESHGDSLSLP